MEDFNYIIGREHVDPDNGLVYTTIQIRKHERFIAADRRLSTAPKGRVEVIHALDVAGYAEPAPACPPLAAVRVSARMGCAEPAAPYISPTSASGCVTARKSKPGQDHVSTVSAHKARGKAQQFGTLKEAPGSPIVYTADSGPPWSSSRNIPPRLNN